MPFKQKEYQFEKIKFLINIENPKIDAAAARLPGLVGIFVTALAILV